MNLGAILSGYPGLLPGLLASIVVGVVTMRRVASLLGVTPVHAFALVLSLGIALSATLTPGAGALSGQFGTGTCDLARFGLATRNQVLRADEVALNLALFVPMGLAIGLLPSTRNRLRLIGSAAALPFAIEVAQLAVIRLGRECQSGDVIDNLTGLAVGIAAGSIIRWMIAVRRVGVSTADSRAGIASLAVIGLIVVVLAAPSQPAVVVPGPTPTPPALATASPRHSVRVSSIRDLLDALADDTIDDIVVADGTYQVSTAGTQAPDSLWIGSRFADRTQAVTVRTETIGGVIIDGGGSEYFGGISFEEGSHHQTWDGFVFANGTPTQTGVITFGGYAGLEAAHHITLRNITIAASVTSSSEAATDHGVYIAEAVGGVHDILIDGLFVDGAGGLNSAIQLYGSSPGHPNARDVTIRRLRVSGTDQAIIIWDPTLRDITIDDAIITDARDFAVRYESPGASNIVLSNISSTGSGSGRGFQSSQGSQPPGVTFSNTSFQ